TYAGANFSAELRFVSVRPILDLLNCGMVSGICNTSMLHRLLSRCAKLFAHLARGRASGKHSRLFQYLLARGRISDTSTGSNSNLGSSASGANVPLVV